MMKKIFYVAFSVLLVVFGLTFSLHNHQTISINYYAVNFQIKLVVLLFFTFIIGVAVGLATVGISALKSRQRAAHYRREASKAKKLIAKNSTI